MTRFEFFCSFGTFNVIPNRQFLNISPSYNLSQMWPGLKIAFVVRLSEAGVLHPT